MNPLRFIARVCSQIYAWTLNARGPYLEFLRNLTPQVLLASLAWFVGGKLDFDLTDISNWEATAAFFIFLFAFLAAFLSSASLFYQGAFVEFRTWNENRRQQLIETGQSRARIFIALLQGALTERPAETLAMVIFMLFLQFIFPGVIVASIIGAVNFLKATHG